MGSVFGKVDAKEPQFQKLKSEPYEVRAYNASVVAEVGCDEATSDAFNTLAKFIGVMGTPENVKAVSAPSTEGEAKVASHEKIAMTAPVITQKNVMQFILPPQYERPDQVPTPSNPNVTIKAVPARTVAVYKFSGLCTSEQCIKKVKKLHKMLLEDHLVEETAPLPLPVSSESSVSSAEEPGQLVKVEGGPAPSPAAPVITRDKGVAEAPAEAPVEAPAGEKGPAPAPEPTEAVKEGAKKTAIKQEATAEKSVTDSLLWLVAQYHPPWTLPFLRRNEVWIELDPQNPAVAKLIQQHEAAQAGAAATTKATSDATAGKADQGVGEKSAGASGAGGVKEGSQEVPGSGQESAGGMAGADTSAGVAAEAPSLAVQQPAPAGEGVSGPVGVPAGASDKDREHVGFTTPPAGPEAENK